MGRPLHPDIALGVHLSAICSRNRFTRDADPVIAELLAVAGDRLDILAMEAGRWLGYYEDEHTRTLAIALREQIPGAAAWVALGRERRGAGTHGTAGFSKR